MRLWERGEGASRALAAPALAATLLVGSCGGEPAELAGESLRVEFSGCSGVEVSEDALGPVCRLAPGKALRLWVEGEGEIRLRGGVSSQAPAPWLGGQRLQVAVDEGVEVLRLELRSDGQRHVWQLRVAPLEQEPWLAETWRRVGAGDHEGARRQAVSHLEAPSPRERGAALALLARLDLHRGATEGVEEGLAQAVVLRRRSGQAYEAIRDATALAWLRIEERRFTGVQALLEELPTPTGHGDSTYLKAYNLGLLALETGEVGRGLARLREATDQASRLGLERWRIESEGVLTRELQRLGALADGEAEKRFAGLVAGAEAAGLTACERGQLLNNQGWAALLAAEAGRPSGSAASLLAEALELLTGCAGAEEQLNVRLNLALALLQEGRPEEALEAVERAREDFREASGNRLLWAEEIEGRCALALEDPGRALELYRDLRARARETSSPEVEWLASYGVAKALGRLGRRADALGEYRRAEELLAGEVRSVPLSQGRGSFASSREDAVRDHLQALVDAGLAEEAWGVARRARSRVWRSLQLGAHLRSLSPDGRERWQQAVADLRRAREEMDHRSAEVWRLSAPRRRSALEAAGRRLREVRARLEELLRQAETEPRALAPPRPGEVDLVYHPLPDGWLGVVRSAEGVEAGRLELAGAGDTSGVGEGPSPRALAQQLLTPFARSIRQATRVRVFPYGDLRQVDFHALPFDGAPLVAGRQVVYPQDLGEAEEPRPRSAAEPWGPGTTLVVADPRGDLPGAREEAREVVRRLRSEGREIEVLLGSEASASALRRRLPAVAFLHYAGHAEVAGWQSALLLGQGSRLGLDDLLLLEEVPRRVVLSGCETGRPGRAVAVETLGLAHAFLAAGSREVLAATRPLPDEEAVALMDAFYEELGSADSFAEALRRSQLRFERSLPESSWASLRVLVP